MKKISLLLLVVLICATQLLAGTDLKIMSFNIRLNISSDGDNAWPHRKELAASMIRFHDADIIGCQEALHDQVTDLDNLLPDYAWFGVGRDDGDSKGEYAVVFYKKDRFQVLNDSTFWLSKTPKKPGYGWDTHFNRIVTLAKIKDLQTGQSFYMLNTHFDHQSTTARRESAKLIVSTVHDIANGLPVIVSGDFNCNQHSGPYKLITAKDSGLGDSKYIAKYPHHGPEGTWSGFTNAYFPDENAPIDHIFVSKGIQVIRHATLSDCINGKFPSDHMPVLAEIILPATEQGK